MRVLTTTLAAAATPGSEDLTGVAAWAVGLMDAIGAPGAAIAIAAENLFPPIPSEVILPLAGFAAAQGSFSLAEALIWTTVGSVVGALALYLLGRLLGHDRLVRIAERMPLVRASDIDTTTAWFRKHGGKAVLFGRVLPIFRSLISIPAGIERMPVWRFLALTTLGSGVWNSIFVLAGFTLGRNWHVVEPYADVLQWVVIAVVVTVVVVWVVRRVLDDRRRRTAGLDPESGRPV
ncbi:MULTISPECIES: DedA family protein [unclassified Agrococcus]|uniref:DedA family protein n=1 Tax=unclassified Agrococcus TaxID=2615065 RepID=UPI003616C5D8